MGKKRVVTQSEEELLQERTKLEEAKRKTKAQKRGISKGRMYISATYNNTIITLTDKDGKVLTWASAGNLGFKGTKKATPYAASEVANVISEKAEKMGMSEVDIFVKGVGSGRSSALRALAAKNIIINLIKDVTPIPHNGCRPRRARRV